MRLEGRLEPADMFPAGRADIRTRYVTLRSGTRLRLAESGNVDSAPVVLIHGWGASLYMWRDWLEPLARAGRRVMAIDLPGHGLSDKSLASEAYSLPSLAAAVRELIDSERLERPDVVAQSMAGTIVLEMLTSEPLSAGRVVLVNPACFGRIRLSRFLRLGSPDFLDAFLPRLVARRIVSRAHRMVYGDPSLVTSRDIDEYWAPSQFPSYARAMRRLVHEFPWARIPVGAMRARLHAIGTPLLVVLGGRDRLVLDAISYARELHAAGATFELEIIEKGGHAVNEELPDDVIRRALAFLER